MRRSRMIGSVIVCSALGLWGLAGCESGHTVSQDKTVRTRSDGTQVKTEEKVVRHSDGTVTHTETKKVEPPD